MAFLWKNLIQAQGVFRLRTILFVLLPFGIMAAVMTQSGTRSSTVPSIAWWVLVMFFTWSLLLGAQMVRCDFRQDVAAMDVLKLYPLRGWQIVAGEVLAPVTIVSAMQWLMLILIAVLTITTPERTGVPPVPLPWFAAAALLVPFWNGLALLIPNASVLLFPGWFQTRADAPQGIEVTGQRLLIFFGQIFVIAIALVPAGFVFAVVYLLLQLAGLLNLAIFAGAAAAGVMMAAEIAAGVWAVGRLFDRFDLAAEQGG